MEFCAIDVETANPDFSSICQIGIAKYSEGRLSEEWKTYVDPEDFFSPINISIHGIDETIVQNAPKLNELADKIYRYLDNNVVICHTSFDRVSINQAFSKYNLRCPEPTWLDSARVARRTWAKFAWAGYGLANICKEIGYEFKCHDALEDAKAAAVVFLTALECSGLNIKGWIHRVEQPIAPKQIKPIQREGNHEGSLYGNNLVFTGSLEIPRREAAEMAAKIGCNIQDGVNKDTTILVVGNQDIQKLAGNEKSSKHRRAEELIMKGQDIRILVEKDFKELIKSECGLSYESLPVKQNTTTKSSHSMKSLQVVITEHGIFGPDSLEENINKDTLSKDEVKVKMTEYLKNDNKREYLLTCKQHYVEAVSAFKELFPELYQKEVFIDGDDNFSTKIDEAKNKEDIEEEIRLLETAIAEGSTNLFYYERLAILLSKQKNNTRAYGVCRKWFTLNLWTYPQISTSSLRFLDRLEKLKNKTESYG